MIHHLLVPGLLELPGGGADNREPLRFPLLERFIARAEAGRMEGHLENLLMQRFGLEPDQGAAPLCYLADTGKRPESGVLRACPVHLRADRDRVLLFPLDDTQLDGEEARELAGRFNAHFSGDDLILEAVRPSRWYLHSARLPESTLAPLNEVAGRSLADFLPSRDKDRFWLSVINETQMLFFDAPVNLDREAAGRLPVNGLWFDGAGHMPSRVPVAPASIHGRHCLLQGLSACAHEQRDEALTVVGDIQEALLAQDANAWRQAYKDLEERLASLMKSTEIMLYSCNGYRWHWKPSSNWRFWRLSRPLPGF